MSEYETSFLVRQLALTTDKLNQCQDECDELRRQAEGLLDMREMFVSLVSASKAMVKQAYATDLEDAGILNVAIKAVEDVLCSITDDIASQMHTWLRQSQ